MWKKNIIISLKESIITYVKLKYQFDFYSFFMYPHQISGSDFPRVIIICMLQQTCNQVVILYPLIDYTKNICWLLIYIANIVHKRKICFKLQY